MPWYSAIGYTLLSWLCRAYAVAYYACYVFPRTAWKYWTGQIPPPPALRPWPTHLPVRLRERAWCAVCEQTLEAGVVRCSVHPEAEVMIVFRDEGSAR